MSQTLGKDDIARACQKCEQKIIDWRREFHANPEISYQEIWTSGRVKEELDKMNIPYDTLPDSLGLVARIEGPTPGKTIALRADMDALPVQEESDAPYKSRVDGKMHACGHDAHMAMLLGAALVLSEFRSSLKGKVFLCFQSAEEHGGGHAEISKYLDDNGGVNRIAGLHIWASIKEGTIMLLDGPAMAGASSFRIQVKGRGGHASRPDLAKDPIKPACEIVSKISSIPSNFYDVLDHCVIHVGKIQGGTMSNIFPDTALIEGGIRFFKMDGWGKIMSHIERIAEGIAKANDVEVDVKELYQIVPPVINHSVAVAEARELVSQVEGLELTTGEPMCAAEPYGYFLQKYPGFFGFLGAMNEEKGIVWAQHNARFDIDETALRKGCEFMCRCALDFLSRA
ncbi:amidohydrolase [Synergistales bacterium]|nr:amidohydrolase [Synergistales bacterium]